MARHRHDRRSNGRVLPCVHRRYRRLGVERMEDRLMLSATLLGAGGNGETLTAAASLELGESQQQCAAMHPDGDFVIVWSGHGEDTSTSGSLFEVGSVLGRFVNVTCLQRRLSDTAADRRIETVDAIGDYSFGGIEGTTTDRDGATVVYFGYSASLDTTFSVGGQASHAEILPSQPEITPIAIQPAPCPSEQPAGGFLDITDVARHAHSVTDQLAASRSQRRGERLSASFTGSVGDPLRIEFDGPVGRSQAFDLAIRLPGADGQGLAPDGAKVSSLSA
jgi:hypothetical protein